MRLELNIIRNSVKINRIKSEAAGAPTIFERPTICGYYIDIRHSFMVLVYYLQVDFLALKNQKALEIGNLFVKGDLRKGLEGVRSPLKPTSFYSTKK